MRVIPKLAGRLPGTVQDMLGIRPGEKVIAWGSSPGADTTQTVFTAATARALYSQQLGQRIPWHTISKATWDEPTLDLVLLDSVDQPGRSVRLSVDDARDLPAAVHDRVVGSVVAGQHVDLGHGAGALMVARRGSDDGEIRWSVVFDAGLDTADPALRREASEALGRLRESLGI